MKTLVMLSLTALALTLNPATSEASEHEGDRGKKMEGFLKKIGVSPEKIKEIRAERKSHKEEINKVHEKKHAEKEKFKAALASHKSEDDLEDIHDEILKFDREMKELKFKKMMKVRSMLDEDQRKKWDEHKAKRWGSYGHGCQSCKKGKKHRKRGMKKRSS